MALPLLLGGVAAFASRAFVVAILTRAAVALGVAAITYVGFSALFDQAVAHIQTQLTGLSAAIASVFILMRVDDAISVVLSAFAVRLTLMALTSAGSLTKITWGRQGELF